MKLADIVPTSKQLELVQGIEGKLLRRRQKGTIGGIAALAGAIVQFLIVVIDRESYLKNIGVIVRELIHLRLGELITRPEGLGMIALVTGGGTYLLFRWTSFLLKESEEPFRYTFCIEPFELVSGTPSSVSPW